MNLNNILTIDHRALGRRIGILVDHQEGDLRRAIVSAFDLDDGSY